MKKFLLLMLFCMIFSTAAYADFGGGLEYTGVVSVPEQLGLLIDTAPFSVVTVGARAYWLAPNDLRLGLFGSMIGGADVLIALKGHNEPIQDFIGYYGGLLVGGEKVLASYILSFNSRVGAGIWGIADEALPPFLYLSSDVEAGFIVGKSTLLTLFAGLGVNIFTEDPALLPVLIPEVGIRLTFGYFWY
jgi:hypothetical protein